MSERAEKLKPVLAALSAEDRAELMADLVGLEEADEPELTPEEWEAEWVDEVNRRVEEIRSGRAKMIPGDEVMRRFREKYG